MKKMLGFFLTMQSIKWTHFMLGLEWDKIYKWSVLSDIHLVVKWYTLDGYFVLPTHMQECLMYFEILPESETKEEPRFDLGWPSSVFLRFVTDLHMQIQKKTLFFCKVSG